MTAWAYRISGDLKQLEDENGKVKRLVADLTLDKTMLQDALRKKW
ncbi:putative transposase [Paracoccus halophilus]|uniref:Putative transposase n=1 Tax=Paracoccus halophilus TaxID=376733 RepID=A0A1I0TBX0_9RHOB|nr:putative transposase [Paracoccus halophilus]